MDGQDKGSAAGDGSFDANTPAGASESDAAASSATAEAGTGASEQDDVSPEAGRDQPECSEEAVHALQAELEQMQARNKELEEQQLRLRAEFENFRRRTRREAEEQRQWAAANLVSALLPVVDNLERATQMTGEREQAPQSFVDGVDLVRKQLVGELERVGLQAIEAAGQPFDPNLHEAVLHEETDEHPDGHVIEELQRGYVLGDKVLRPSVVKVAKGT